MNFTRKKIGAALLSLFIMGGAVSVPGVPGIFNPAVASAAENDTITYDETTHVLTLRGELNVVEILQYRDKGVKTIIAEKGSSLLKYPGHLFKDFKTVETIDLSNVDGSRAIETYNMFSGCEALKEVKLCQFNNPQLNRVGAMFYNCKSLETIDLSPLKTSSVTNFGMMFFGCSSLKNLDLTCFDTSKGEVFSAMFGYCTSLTDLNVSNWNTKNAWTMESMFINCTSLRSLDISSFDTSKLNTPGYTTPSYMFDGCDNLAPYICYINGGSISLDGNIGVNFYVTLGSDAAKAVLSGPKGEIVIDDLAPYKLEDGSYKFSYPVNALQMSDKVKIRFYDKDGGQLILFNNSNTPVPYATGSFSVRDYINAAKQNTDEKLADLANAIDSYGIAAENHFRGTTNEVSLGEVVKKDNVADFKPTFGTDISISLVLGSETSLRIYTDKENVTINGVTANEETSQYGRYYEIKNIPAHKLMDDYIVVADGSKFTVNPMNYVYRVLDREDAPPTLSVVAKAVYVYAKAAETYMNAQ